jgi:hypothetical protein
MADDIVVNPRMAYGDEAGSAAAAAVVALAVLVLLSRFASRLIIRRAGRLRHV